MTSSSHRSDDLPQVFGRYLLVQRLSRGGMGEVFVAKHGLSGFEKICVIKKVLPHLVEDERFISRFVDEAQVAIRLQHANIAQVFEVGRVGDEYFLAIELIEGRDLRRSLRELERRRERFPIDLALLIAREVANGLAYAHRRKDLAGDSLELVHCDISPPNVLVSFEGEVKIIDFGISKSVMRATATDPRMGFGKFGYMAPEQLIKGGKIDFRTDVYAAGSVLFELLTGQRLYVQGENPDYRALAKKVIRGQHAKPSDIDPNLAPYDELVGKALEPKPGKRFQTAAELRDAIQHALVRINPTLASDSLGEHMREIFAGELDEWRSLAARAQAASLSDWAIQLENQSDTVSFALASVSEGSSNSAGTGSLAPHASHGGTGPGSAPPAHSSPGPSYPVHSSLDGVSHLRSGPQTLLPSGSQPQHSSNQTPTAMTYASLPSGPHARRKRWSFGAFLIGIVAVALLGGTAFAVLSAWESQPPGSPPKVESLAAAEPPSGSLATATVPGDSVLAKALDLADDGDGDGDGDGSTDAAGADGDKAESKTRPGDQDARKRQKRRDRRKARDRSDEKQISRSKVESKFRSLARDYKKFKASYGARLDKEWSDLMQAVQYAGNDPDKLREVSSKIRGLRAKIRKLSADG